MGIPCDDVVLIQQGNKPGDPTVITVNCPDKAGLGCDLCRIVVDFGLSITKGDFCTDGNWCYIVLWTVPQPSSLRVDWESLKTRLQAACPFVFDVVLLQSAVQWFPTLDIIHVEDVTKALCQLELTIQRVKVMTTPDDKVLNLFFITDNVWVHLSCLRKSVYGSMLWNMRLDHQPRPYEILQMGSLVMSCKSVSVALCCIAYGRISPSLDGRRNMDLFIQKTDGKKIVDPDNQTALCSRLKEEMLHPLRVTIANRGPDTELLVANPAELSGKGRPRVFYDVTCRLKLEGISTSDREWEVYRFLLDESREFPLASSRARSEIVDRVRSTLMGWSLMISNFLPLISGLISLPVPTITNVTGHTAVGSFFPCACSKSEFDLGLTIPAWLAAMFRRKIGRDEDVPRCASESREVDGGGGGGGEGALSTRRTIARRKPF
ncbi:ACT domain-containing protein [Actinidia rufa]|uniref:ACT domain-containing protein ACR n=1 Tax=Actinidia rufa TaxID=165716 RepID=A0A7J0GVY1_9ERIC|nr:ACT domain-containing protein [Actinidia rufa]